MRRESVAFGEVDADALIDELRISRIARYRKPFTPRRRFKLDLQTSALFHFDGSLEGSGMTMFRETYSLHATAGAAMTDTP